MTDDAHVWITTSSRSNRVFHTNPGCPYLPEDPTRRRRDPLEEMDYEECTECAGEARTHDIAPDRSIYSAALKAGRSGDD